MKIEDYSPEFILERILVLRDKIRGEAGIGGYKNEMTGILNRVDGLSPYCQLLFYETVSTLQKEGCFVNNFQFGKESLKEELNHQGNVYSGLEWTGRFK